MFQNRNNFLSSIPVITKNIIIINILMLLAANVLPSMGIDLTRYLGLHFFKGSDFNLVQLFTYMFMHGGVSHLFFNMFSLYMFGRTLEMVWGPKRFLIYYLVTGIGAGLIQEVVWFFEFRDVFSGVYQMVQTPFGSETVDAFLNRPITVGASGSVFGILLAFGMLFPNAELFLMFVPVPIKAKYMVFFYGLIELFMGVANFSGDSIAHFAHLGGMLFGFILIKLWKKQDFDNGRYFY